MLSSSDPFIFLGPDCPTLYYPKPTGDQPAPDQQNLPSFIVARSSVQPYAFILPTSRNMPVAAGPAPHQPAIMDSVSAGLVEIPLVKATAGIKKRNSSRRGQVGKRKTGKVSGRKKKNTHQPSPVQFQLALAGPDQVEYSSSQAEWLLNTTRENFVYVEADQMVSQAMIAGNITSGDTEIVEDQNNNQAADWSFMNNIEESSLASNGLDGAAENENNLFVGAENYELFNQNSNGFEGCSDDLKDLVFEIVKRNSETESDDESNDQGGFVLGDSYSQIDPRTTQNLFLNHTGMEPGTGDLVSEEFVQVNLCEEFGDDYTVRDDELCSLDREEVFDMNEEVSVNYDNDTSRQKAEDCVHIDANREPFELRFDDEKIILDTHHAIQTKNPSEELVKLILETLLDDVYHLSSSMIQPPEPESEDSRISKSETSGETKNIDKITASPPLRQMLSTPHKGQGEDVSHAGLYNDANTTESTEKDEDVPLLLCPETGMVYYVDQVKVDLA